MGRYDRVRVYVNGTWYQPSRMYTYLNGQWVDFGSNNDYHRNSMHVLYGGSWRRFLLYREDYTVEGDSYSYGQGKLRPKAYTGWNPNSNTSGEHYFSCTVYKDKHCTSDRTIFESYATNDSCYFRIIWQPDGRIRCEWKSAYSSSHPTSTITTDHSVDEGQWADLTVQCNKNSYKVNIDWDGHRTSENMYSTWTVTNCDNTLGDDNIRFRGKLSAQLGYYKDGKSRPYHFSCDMDEGEGDITGMDVADTSYTATRWI